MAIVVTGQLTPIEKIKRIRVTPSGQSTDVEVEGVRPYVLEMIQYYATIPGLKDLQYEADGASAKIEATYAGPPAGVTEVPLDRISLRSVPQQLSLYLNDRYVWIPARVMKEIRQTLADGTNYSEATGRITEACLFEGGLSNQIPLELYDSILIGNDSFEFVSRNITRTRTVSPRFNTNVAQADVGSLFTGDQLVTALSGSTLPFEVPALTLTAEDTTMGRIVAWRKTQCDVDDTAGGQRQLTESWQLAKWMPGVYPVKA